MTMMLWTVPVLLLVAPAAAMTKADIISEISDKTGIDKPEAKSALDLFFSLTTARNNESEVGLSSYSVKPKISSGRRVPKKPKEIVVVGSKVAGGRKDHLGSGGLNDDCNLAVDIDLPLILRDDWPIELGMKVRASVKRRDVESCVQVDESLLRNGIDIDLFLTDLPEIGDEVLTVSFELPLSALLVASDRPDGERLYQSKLDNMALFLPTAASYKGDYVGSLIAGQLDLRGQTLPSDATTEGAFFRTYTAALGNAENAGIIFRIIKNNLAPIHGVGFGTFSISKRAARTGRNPQTGAIIKIEPQNRVRFKAGKALATTVN